MLLNLVRSADIWFLNSLLILFWTQPRIFHPFGINWENDKENIGLRFSKLISQYPNHCIQGDWHRTNSAENPWDVSRLFWNDSYRICFQFQVIATSVFLALLFRPLLRHHKKIGQKILQLRQHKFFIIVVISSYKIAEKSISSRRLIRAIKRIKERSKLVNFCRLAIILNIIFHSNVRI